MSKLLICLAVLASSLTLGSGIKCYVCSDCDKDNNYEAVTCQENEDTCAVGIFDSVTYRSCSTVQACTAGKNMHENLNNAWNSVKSIFNDDIQGEPVAVIHKGSYKKYGKVTQSTKTELDDDSYHSPHSAKGKEFPKMECCYTHLCNGSYSNHVTSFFTLILTFLLLKLA